MIDALYDYIDRLPKVELHLHLEGSLPVRVLKQLSGYNGEDLDALYHYASFYDFLMAFRKVCLMLREPGDFERVIYELLAQLARQNVWYAEIFFSPSIHRRNGRDLGRALDGIYRGRAAAQTDFGIEMALLLDGVRQWGLDEARYVLDLATEHRAHGVIGIGIGGDEEAAPPELFSGIYDEARARGLHTVAHAGEVAGPSSVWNALRALRVERIGHGLRAIEDAELIAYLRATQVPIEVSLTSNVMTGALAALSQHPIRDLFDAGLQVTLNSDDPAMFNTSLTAEYRLLATHFNFTAAELRRVAMNGFQSTFLPAEHKQALLTRFVSDTA